MTKFCRYCGKLLTESNRFRCDVKRRELVCKKCRMKANLAWRHNHKDSILRWKAHRRQTEIRYSDRVLRGHKRDHPIDNRCEVCGRQTKHLVYHHYIDLNLTVGMWLCACCHIFAEWYDRGFLPVYLRKKEEVWHQEYELTYKNGFLSTLIYKVDDNTTKEVQK